MNSGVTLIVYCIHVGTSGDEELCNGLVSSDDCQMERSVPLFILFVNKFWFSVQDLLDAIQILVVSTIMQGSLSCPIRVSN